jgi:hypothetical protein
MNCLTLHQLAAISLGHDEEPMLSSHLADCAACRTALADMRRLQQQLGAAHAALDQYHAVSRQRLLDSLSAETLPTASAQPKHLLAGISAFIHRHRFAAGGLGFSTAAALVVLFVILANSATKLSAMERMLHAVREVTSYRFNQGIQRTVVAADGTSQVDLRENYSACWRAPDEAHLRWLGDLHAEVKNCHIPRLQPCDAISATEDSAGAKEKLTLHLAETYPCGLPSLIVVYTEGYYFWTPPVLAGDMPVDNTIAKLRAVQQGNGETVRDLGSRTIRGREARGYRLAFGDAVPFRGDGPVDVWLDPQTDLPVEFSYQRTDDYRGDKYTYEYHLTDIEWNIGFSPDQFATIPPAGLIDTTPPTNDQGVDQIVAALKLYAELSGGHYPAVRTLDPGAKRNLDETPDPRTVFDANRVRDEMLHVAGYTGPPQADWSKDTKYQQIEAAKPALDWLSRMLRNDFQAGFFGTEVTAQDTDKVLLWCMSGERAKWRIIYGDLHTEVVLESKFYELVPSAAAGP